MRRVLSWGFYVLAVLAVLFWGLAGYYGYSMGFTPFVVIPPMLFCGGFLAMIGLALRPRRAPKDPPTDVFD
jgi:hypothetical protein